MELAPLDIRLLGRVPFPEALALQEQLVAEALAVRASGNSSRHVLLLLEHDPVYTIGRTRDQSSLGSPGNLPHPCFEINRGGRATYHGPGQLVGYPLLDLSECGKDLHRYLRFLEEFLLALLDDFGVASHLAESLTGAWVGDKKIASIGVGIRHWVSMHGFALNITRESLAGFDAITPCGISGVRMTCVSAEAGREVTVEEAAEAAARRFNSFWERLPLL